jgi:hypothetical protein
VTPPIEPFDDLLIEDLVPTPPEPVDLTKTIEEPRHPESDCTPTDYLGTYEGVRGEPGDLPGTLPRITYALDKNDDGIETRTPSPVEDSDIVSSALPDGMHAPCIDIDIPATYVPSSTPGQGHLDLEVPLTWADYERLLTVMAEVGIVEDGYVRASATRKATHLRLPWVKKP